MSSSDLATASDRFRATATTDWGRPRTLHAVFGATDEEEATGGDDSP